MFTGLVEGTGEILSLELRGESARLRVHAPAVTAGLQLGDSIAVNGCCLTAAATEPEDIIAFDLLRETLARTNLGDLAPGALVNLERALAVGARLGGHFVQGHIDCATRIVALEPAGNDWRFEIELPAEFARYVVPKGSIAIDGISLTAAAVSESSVTVWIIPHTLAVTALKGRKVGDRVNLEFDLLAKYVERLVAAGAAPTPGM